MNIAIIIVYTVVVFGAGYLVGSKNPASKELAAAQARIAALEADAKARFAALEAKVGIKPPTP